MVRVITVDYLTRHERGVLVAALRHYHSLQSEKARTLVKADRRAQAGANAYVSSDLLRVLTQR